VAADLAFEPISFTYSFRSGAAVLRAVEYAFRSPDIYRSITTDRDGMPPHEALDDAGPGLIELWPLAEADKRDEIEGWRAPFDGVSVTSPEVKLSKRIQAEIKRLVASGTMTGPVGNRRPLTYGDVLVLVRRRGNLFDAVIQSLKHASIPVAGADRLKLTEHIAIIDLMNLADALLLPRDDLALAVTLKSPLFGLDENDLFKLAWERKGALRTALSNHAKDNPKFGSALRRLEQCERRFAHDTPFAFYAWLLGGDGGRSRILERLGHEANDALDEFLELALNYERKAPASLQGFMAWLRSADTEVKRDMEISRDEVRVMTVHGAKGLEAPVVIMVDTTSSPTDTQRLRLIQVPHENREVTVWAGRKADDPQAVVPAREKMLGDTEDEYRRLLYVAMTRAADRLIVAGIQPGNRNGVRPDCWYDLVKKGLSNSGLQEEAIDTDDGQIKRYTRPEDGAHVTGAAAPAAITSQPLPSWLRTPMPPQGTGAGLLRPSQANGDAGHRVKSTEAIAQRTRALQQGTLVHRLLQSLPELPPERRRDAALAHLSRNASAWSATEREALAGKVIGLVADSRFAAVFADGSRAEVAIVGRLTLPGRPPALVSGQIDRLVVTQNEVLIVDFKTNHAPPTAAAETPQAYVRQLALYRAVLGKLYPQYAIRAALLWTESADLMEISAPALDAELASLGTGIDPATPRS
jgi:ATP-dependent helicase/nuclease subunit A